MTDQLRQAAQQALEAMVTNQYTVAELAPHKVVMKFNDAITTLREALKQPEQEPVRWQWIFEDKHGDRYTHKNLFYTEAEAAESARICGVKAIKKTGESKVTATPPAAQPEPVAKLFGTLPVYDTAAQPEQEPVAMDWQRGSVPLGGNSCSVVSRETIPFEFRQPAAQPAQEPVAWILTDENINSIQVASVQRLIDRLKHAHHTDLCVRINGQDEWFQADWIKHMVRASPPAAQPEQEPTPWREMIVVTLVREGINKHKARELADHFAAQPEQVDCPRCGHVCSSREQEPVAWGVFEGNLHDMFFTQEEAQEMAQLKGSHAEVRPLYTAPPAAQPKPQYDKTEMNCFVQNLYDEKMREGKHGHYETMFHCVHQAIARVTPPAAQRPWVGLTDEDWDKVGDMPDTFDQGVAWAQARLKERNNG